MTARIAAALLALALAGPARADSAADCQDAATPPADAVAACTAALEMTLPAAERATLHLWRGYAHRVLGNHDAALADFDEAEWLLPADAVPMIERSYVLAEQGDAAAAADEALRGIAAEPGSLGAHHAAMSHLASAGRTEECLDLVPQAMALAPEDPMTLASRGRCLHEGGRPAAAISDYRRAIALGLDDAFVHGNLALLLLDQGAASEAAVEARRTAELDPGSALALRTLLVALVELGEPEAAIAAWREGARHLAGEADRSLAANDLAWNLYVAGRHAEGMAVMEEALAAGLSLGDVDVADTHAHLLAAAGRPEEAAEAFLEAARLGGADRRAIYEDSLAALGFAPGRDFAAAVRACAATGTACRLFR